LVITHSIRMTGGTNGMVAARTPLFLVDTANARAHLTIRHILATIAVCLLAFASPVNDEMTADALDALMTWAS